jgi:hypothetical protein
MNEEKKLCKKCKFVAISEVLEAKLELRARDDVKNC